MYFRKGALKGVSSQPFSGEKQDYTNFYRATHLCAINIHGEEEKREWPSISVGSKEKRGNI